MHTNAYKGGGGSEHDRILYAGLLKMLQYVKDSTNSYWHYFKKNISALPTLI